MVILSNWRICYSDRGDGWQDMRLFLLYTWWDLGWGVWKFGFIGGYDERD